MPGCPEGTVWLSTDLLLCFAGLQRPNGQRALVDLTIRGVKVTSTEGWASSDGQVAEPVQAGSNSFYIHPASVAHIRKFLFGLLGGTPQEAALAKSCLIAIDVLRDEHDIAANDTRHPDVLSEIPWPPEAA